MDIVLFGKPGAGKGPKAPRLAEALGGATLSTGDVLRNAIKDGTKLGLEAKSYMDRGDLVPDSVILGIIGEALKMPLYAKGTILDGVVRTVPQAEGSSRRAGVAGPQSRRRHRLRHRRQRDREADERPNGVQQLPDAVLRPQAGRQVRQMRRAP